MKKTGKSTFFIVVAFIALFTVSAIVGLDYLFGDSRKTIMLHYFLPAVLSKILVVATQSVSSVVLQSSAMSFLGLGVKPPTPDWGYMISEGKEYIRAAWWLPFFPGMAVFFTSISLLRA